MIVSTVRAASPAWRERLPENCPPRDAIGLVSQPLLRLVGPSDVCDDDFKSHQALGRPCLNGRHCEWAACSLFLLGTRKEQFDTLRKFPTLKDKTGVAYVAVDQKSGVGKVNTQSKHVSLWMYSSFDPVKHVTKVVPINEYTP